MKIIKKERFKAGAWYKTGYYAETGEYISGIDVKCVSVEPYRTKAVFLIGGKEQEYELVGESVVPEFTENKNGETGLAMCEIAVRPFFVTPVYDPYSSIKSVNFVSRIAVARKKAGLSQAKLSKLLGIPKRTIENWESGVNVPAEYTERSIIEKLEEMERNE